MRPLKGMFALLATFVVGCGGGGGSQSASQPIDPNQKTVIVPAGQALQATLGQAIVTSGSLTSPTTITLKQSPAPKVAQPTFSVAQPLLTLSADTQPSSALTVSYPDNGQGRPAMAAIYDGAEPIGAVPVIKQGNQLVFTIDPANLPISRSGRSASWAISFLLGIATKVFPVDQTVSLKPIGSPQGQGRYLIYCHGLLQTADDDTATILALKDAGQYDSALSLAYDWRQQFTDVGIRLAELLKTYPTKSVDIVCYSKGGDAVRWALEQRDATRAVRGVMFLATPNQGCSVGVAVLFSALAVQFLLNPLEIPMVFSPNDNALAELLPTSAHLSTLNSPTYHQNGEVNYLFVAGKYLFTSNDKIVGIDSALLTNSQTILNRTNGRIDRLTLPGDHFSLHKPEPALTAYKQFVAAKSGISIAALPNNPLEASSDTGSWTYDLVIANNTGQDITIESIQYEGFDRNGAWTGNFWYKPGSLAPNFFPQTYYSWNQPLGRGQSTKIGVQTWADLNRTPVWDAAVDRKAGSVNFILLARGKDGARYESKEVVSLTYQSYKPKPPQTRAARVSTNLGPMGIGSAP